MGARRAKQQRSGLTESCGNATLEYPKTMAAIESQDADELLIQVRQQDRFACHSTTAAHILHNAFFKPMMVRNARALYRAAYDAGSMHRYGHQHGKWEGHD
eukprot:1260364-Amphidinium_carterae.1